MTNLKQFMLSVVLMVATSTSTIWAQTHVTGFVPVVGSRGHYGGYHSSTAGEGFLRGYADLARARGMAAAYYSQAAINIETARRQYLENRKLQLEYNRAHAQAREERNHRRREDLARRRATYKRLVAKRNAKDRVDWPTALVGKRYESLRDEIESLVQIRSRLGTRGGGAAAVALKYVTRELANQIIEDEQSNRFSPQESQVIRQFVRSLTWQPTQTVPAEAKRVSQAMNVASAVRP